MTDKELYIENQISRKAQFWVNAMLIMGIVLFPFIAIADYFATPENFQKFFRYRVIITTICFIFFFLNRLKRNKHYQYTLIYIIVVCSAMTIEMMILSFGGHASTYYAGLNLLIIAALGLVPFSVPLTISAGLSIYAVYLIPILIFDKITDPSTFIANNVFMISTYVIVFTWKIMNKKTMLNELGLQYDLEQEKQNLERLVAERTKELNKSEQWHRSLFENATDGVIVLDKTGNIVNINEKAAEMHGFARDALIDVNIELLENDDNREQATERMGRIQDGESLVFETTHRKKDGAPIHLEISSKAITIADELFIQSFYRDITEKKKMREHLSQTQKMESIGVLAGGIAHDFNNILAAILGHTEVVRVYSASLDAKSLRSLQVIEDASRKAGGMISKLLGFARKSTYEMVPLNLNDVIHDTVKLLERVLDKNISLKVELDGQLPVIKGDFNQLEQVIMNLMVNARDAMPQGGRITIATHCRKIEKGMTDVPPYVLPGEYVLMSVTDTGSGVPEHLVQKIFEPFFTTKERGKGTGLGLSMVYGAVKEHKGYIIVQSRPGKGSAFIVYLPVSREVLSWAGKEMETFINGKETILFVDDEEDVLSAARDVLTSHGYKVEAANDPELALEFFRKTPRRIDLVITDMVMPKTDGKEFIRQLRTINPGTKILAVSGYMKYVAEKEDIKNINGFLQKPFDSRHLLSTIRKILDARPEASPPLDV